MSDRENDAKKLGFGCMRLSLKGGAIDTQEMSAMVDAFLNAGFHYFDTAHPYHYGESEKAIKTCLTSRYPRDSYILTDKLSTHNFTKQEDIRPLFQSQLDACGVEYFDYYLMHAQSADIFAKFKSCRAYETALEFLDEGRIKHFGISFHDKAAVLEQILAEYPQIEVVQIQLNYLDYDDPGVESRKCYEVCRCEEICPQHLPIRKLLEAVEMTTTEKSTVALKCFEAMAKEKSIILKMNKKPSKVK